MHWFDPNNITDSFIAPDANIQNVTLFANMEQVPRDIPVPPKHVEDSDGMGGDALVWYGKIDSRIVVATCGIKPDVGQANEITIITPFACGTDNQKDWLVLTELGELPGSIYPTRPLRIGSRASRPKTAVYRPNKTGWRDTVYEADGDLDAELLLQYMLQDQWNRGCYTGQPSPAGEWQILVNCQGYSQVIGAYTDADTAIRVACEMSGNRIEYEMLQVKNADATGSPTAYRIRCGRVDGPHS